MGMEAVVRRTRETTPPCQPAPFAERRATRGYPRINIPQATWWISRLTPSGHDPYRPASALQQRQGNAIHEGLGETRLRTGWIAEDRTALMVRDDVTPGAAPRTAGTRATGGVPSVPRASRSPTASWTRPPSPRPITPRSRTDPPTSASTLAPLLEQ